MCFLTSCFGRYASWECPLGESESKRLIKRRPWHDILVENPQEVRTPKSYRKTLEGNTQDHKVSHWIAVSSLKCISVPIQWIICTSRPLWFYRLCDLNLDVNDKVEMYFSISWNFNYTGWVKMKYYNSNFVTILQK